MKSTHSSAVPTGGDSPCLENERFPESAKAPSVTSSWRERWLSEKKLDLEKVKTLTDSFSKLISGLSDKRRPISSRASARINESLQLSFPFMLEAHSMFLRNVKSEEFSKLKQLCQKGLTLAELVLERHTDLLTEARKPSFRDELHAHCLLTILYNSPLYDDAKLANNLPRGIQERNLIRFSTRILELHDRSSGESPLAETKCRLLFPVLIAGIEAAERLIESSDGSQASKTKQAILDYMAKHQDNLLTLQRWESECSASEYDDSNILLGKAIMANSADSPSDRHRFALHLCIWSPSENSWSDEVAKRFISVMCTLNLQVPNHIIISLLALSMHSNNMRNFAEFMYLTRSPENCMKIYEKLTPKERVCFLSTRILQLNGARDDQGPLVPYNQGFSLYLSSLAVLTQRRGLTLPLVEITEKQRSLSKKFSYSAEAVITSFSDSQLCRAVSLFSPISSDHHFLWQQRHKGETALLSEILKRVTQKPNNPTLRTALSRGINHTTLQDDIDIRLNTEEWRAPLRSALEAAVAKHFTPWESAAIVDQWLYACSENRDPSQIIAALRNLSKLSKYSPHAPKTLLYRCGIRMFGRYALSTLLTQLQILEHGNFLSTTLSQPIFVIQGGDDHNNSMSAVKRMSAYKEGAFFTEAYSPREAIRACRTYYRLFGAAQNVVVHSHGAKNEIVFSSHQPVTSEFLSRRIARKILRDFIADRGTLVVDSCSSGDSQGFVERFHGILAGKNNRILGGEGVHYLVNVIRVKKGTEVPSLNAQFRHYESGSDQTRLLVS